MKKRIPDIICGLLIFLFVYAAVSKLSNYDQFKGQIEAGPLKRFSSFIKWFIPIVELLISLMLTVASTKKVGLYGALALLLIFTGYITVIVLSGKNLPCSCGGVIQSLSWQQHLVFNLFFIGLAFTGLLMEKKRNKISDPL